MAMNTPQKIGVALFIGLVVIALILCIGLLLVSPYSGFLYFVGVIVGVILLLPIVILVKKRKILAMTGYVFILLIITLFAAAIHFAPLSPATNFKILKYRAVIKPINDDYNEFSLTEEILLEYELIDKSSGNEPAKPIKSTESLKFPDKVIKSQNRSFFIKEVSFTPLGMNESGFVNVTRGEGQQSIPFCGFDCPVSSIRLLNFPKDSFSEARTSKKLEKSTYVDKETINWEVERPNEGISFSFFPSPYQNFSFIFKPFIGVSSIGSFALVLLGLGSASIFTILGSLFSDKITDSIKPLLDKFFRRPSDKKKNKAGFVRDRNKKE